MSKSHPLADLRRRNFLQLVVVSASGAALPACSSEDDPAAPPAPRPVFEFGVASGDPKPDSVILWTRAYNNAGTAHPVAFEVATDEAFAELVASGEAEVGPDDDFCLGVKVTDLSPYTTYYYRFTAQGEESTIGRTKTAPADDQDVAVRFAFASCQDRNGRYYHAWEALLAEAETNDVDFVLFLGDYIYETEGDPRFQSPTEQRKTVVIDGIVIGDPGATYNAALSLRDYRLIYQQYRSDPSLQAVHARFPFVMLWDDHEFADDCWQDHATHFNGERGDEKSTQRRADATKAWREYMPVDIEYDASAAFPNDIQIYRNLRFGLHVDLFITDQRYYRSDHAVPEGPINVSTAKIEENSALGARSLVLKAGFDEIEAAAGVTMLGDTQRQWFLDSIGASTATWKVWANETQLSQMLVDLSGVEALPDNFKDVFYFTVDQWDGYRTERAEIVTALDAIENVVAVTGDIHAFYASEIFADFDNPAATPSLIEYVTSGISSSPVQEITTRTIEGSETLSGLGLLEVVPQFDTLLQSASPHYKHLDSNTNGVAIATVDATGFTVDFLAVGDVKNPDDTGEKGRTTFRTPVGQRVIEMA